MPRPDSAVGRTSAYRKAVKPGVQIRPQIDARRCGTTVNHGFLELV